MLYQWLRSGRESGARRVVTRLARVWLAVVCLAAVCAAQVALGCGGASSGERGRLDQPAPIEPANPIAQTFFWRIDGPRGPSYLLGTMHVGVDPRDVLPPGIWEKFDAARVFVMEVNTTGPDTLGLGRQPDGHTLDGDMTPEQWALLLDKLGLTADDAAPLREVLPWMLIAQLTQQLAPKARSIEDVLHARAQAAGKPLAFIESARVQAKLLERFIDVDYLIEFVSDMPKQKRALARQAEIYRSGDDDAMIQSALVNMEKHIGADGMETLMYRRNRAWVPLLEPHLRRGGAFIAVGVAHLVGDRSVIALLRARGYSIARIPQ
jgi:hypothetical protein